MARANASLAANRTFETLAKELEKAATDLDKVKAEASSETGDASLSEAQAREVLAAALNRANLAGLAGKRVLVLIPDGTRTAPMAMMFRLLSELVGETAASLDFLVALGTHRPMDEAALSRRQVALEEELFEL